MSQEMNQGSQPRKNTIIYWIVIAVLLATCIYMFLGKKKATEQNEQTTAQLVVSDSTRKTVENDYNAALARLDQLTGKNVQLDSMVNVKDGEIAKLKDQIGKIMHDKNATASQLAKAKELISTLNNTVKSYEERIAQLEQENGKLSNANAVITKERDSTVTQNIALKQLGSVLHASNIRMVPIHQKRSGKETATTKARKVDLMKITFDIDENRIADNGTKEIYIRIVGPDGNMISNAASGSGVTGLADGKSLNYTVMKQIPLEKGKPVNDVSMNWHQDGDYLPGNYGIEIYNSGYLIGKGSVNLK
jgi:cell division protein FtsB